MGVFGWSYFTLGWFVKQKKQTNELTPEIAYIFNYMRFSDLVYEMINEGILDPEGSSVETWRFNAVAIKRIQVACRLQNDLRVNLPGDALALDLLEELEGLRSRTTQLS